MASPDFLPTVLSLLYSFLDLAKGSLAFTVPVLILSWLGFKVRTRIQKKFKFKWLPSTFLTIFLCMAVVVILAYVVPLISTVWTQTQVLQNAPDFFKPTLYDYLLVLANTVFKVLLTSLAAAFLLTPFALLGSLFKAWVDPKVKNEFLALAVSAFLTVLVFSFLFLYVFNFAFLGIIYLLYFSPGPF